MASSGYLTLLTAEYKHSPTDINTSVDSGNKLFSDTEKNVTIPTIQEPSESDLVFPSYKRPK
jgi:hypothetical protein